MSVRFLSSIEGERFRTAINSDPEFNLAAKFMTEDMLLEVGNAQCIVRVNDGEVTEINVMPTRQDSWSFAIKAPLDSWEKFLQPVPPPFYTSLIAGMERGTMQVVGNLEAAYAYFWAVNRMLDIMRDVNNS